MGNTKRAVLVAAVCLVVAIAAVAYAAGRGKDGDSSSVSARIDALAAEMAQEFAGGGSAASSPSYADEMAQELGTGRTAPVAATPKPETKRLSEGAKARIEQHLLDHPTASDSGNRAALAKAHPGWHSEALATAYAEVVKRPCVRAIREQRADTLRWQRGLLAGAALGALLLVAYRPTRRRLSGLVMVVSRLAGGAVPRSSLARRRTGAAVLALLALGAAAFFGVYVWPTAWTYPSGSLVVLGSHPEPVQVAKRVNRFTGEVQILTTGGWVPLSRTRRP